jgi:hypothetical protein
MSVHTVHHLKRVRQQTKRLQMLQHIAIFIIKKYIHLYVEVYWYICGQSSHEIPYIFWQ